MTTKNWPRFFWNLDRETPAVDAVALGTLIVREATAADRVAVERVIQTALGGDIAAGELLKSVEQFCDDCFREKPPLCAVVSHGSRIIGASIMTGDVDAESHFLTGPCVLHEYHRRGLGTALLAKSLEMLREHGLTLVYAVAAPHTAVAKFLYPASGAEVVVSLPSESAGMAEAG